MAKFLFNLPDDKLEQLRQKAQDNNLSVSEYLRQGVDWIISSKVPCSIITSGSVSSGFILVMR